MSTNFPGWCCCQEILIHDKGFCKLGTEANLQMDGPYSLLCLSGWDSTWLLRPVEGSANARSHIEAAMWLPHRIPSLVPWGCSCKATISLGCPLEVPRTKGPHKKYFKMPETKIKLQCCGDTSVLTVAKYAISLKQWRNEGGGRNVLWFIYLFPVAVENFLQAKGRPETDPICQLWISINNEHNSLRVFK